MSYARSWLVCRGRTPKSAYLKVERLRLGSRLATRIDVSREALQVELAAVLSKYKPQRKAAAWPPVHYWESFNFR